MATEGQAKEILLGAEHLMPVAGNPVKIVLEEKSQTCQGWTFSAKATDDLLAGKVEKLPAECKSIKVEITIHVNDPSVKQGDEDVYYLVLSQQKKGSEELVNQMKGKPVRTKVISDIRTIQLESYYDTDPSLMLNVKVGRLPRHPADSFDGDTTLTEVRIIPLPSFEKSSIVQDMPGYNSWPMIQAIGKKLVCIYSRGLKHSIGDGERNVYASTSDDNGKSWSPEILVTGRPDYGEVATGKGLDESGAALFWIRCCGPVWPKRHHELFRTTDGVTFTKLASTKLDPEPMQITDIFSVPGVGLMALWFNTNYTDKTNNSWGTLISGDQGKSWGQHTVEQGATVPEEPSALYLGGGRILAIGRSSVQLQMESVDYGRTWICSETNITDVAASTPSLILDPETGIISNYSYHRGRGVLKRHCAKADAIFGHPCSWSPSEAIAEGSKIALDSGNANATSIGSLHFIVFYTGKAPNTSVVVFTAKAPAAK